MLIRRRGDARRTAQSEPSLEETRAEASKRSDGLRLGCLRQLQCGTTVLPSNGACSFDPKDPTRPPLAPLSRLSVWRILGWRNPEKREKEYLSPHAPLGQ